ncbi:bacterioferritin [Thiohalorhabdus denitrificans]|uniref:Bacterioferritin n=1 Tax=Thiohalorhabdus denitrificans TaxID=381306 RepID=A0A0P9CVM0_9GAMM|nr:bacterioferritin [Thiohalorhabdus denitrificans]KPV40706.1 bacterioferritin [Thiohalorhabdus denitrificans]SCY46458.1 bacterioferritin [Thiohalorhabdus denitrificans]
MKGDAKVIEYLNRVLTNELTAINQYFMHAKMCEDWGLKKLAEVTRKESIEEMRHAEELMDRVLFLEGLPNLQDLGKLRVGEDVQEQLRNDLGLEQDAIPLLREAIVYCRENGDEVSKDLFQRILDDEEEHVDFLETQLELIDKVGLQNYLQTQMESAG